jgi:hypothetical protein
MLQQYMGGLNANVICVKLSNKYEAKWKHYKV